MLISNHLGSGSGDQMTEVRREVCAVLVAHWVVAEPGISCGQTGRRIKTWQVGLGFVATYSKCNSINHVCKPTDSNHIRPYDSNIHGSAAMDMHGSLQKIYFGLYQYIIFVLLLPRSVFGITSRQCFVHVYIRQASGALCPLNTTWLDQGL